ncbi:hypothetical protein BDZ89DRAFT_997258 [Hymenopellis radicata]|nr:hypothetical protein BDZ89DRAFT_997258 [Hymenopellis radicata]
MSLFSRFAALALFVAFLPTVLSHGGGDSSSNYGSSDTGSYGGDSGSYGGSSGSYGGGSSSSGSSSCSSSEFWFSKKGCCLPSGGVPSKPTPPTDTECPDTHYWGNDKGCCLPSNPPGGDQPSCPNNWSWNDDLDYCQPPTTTTPPSQPSHGYGYHNKAKRDALKSRSAPLCPLGLDACPIPGMEAGDYECMDTSSDLEACGGCPSLGQGQDCTAIDGAWNVACEEKRCIVYSCAPGFMKSYDGKTCVSLA